MSNRKSFSLLSLALVIAVGFAIQGQQPATHPTPVEIKIAATAFDPYVGQYEDAANLGGTIFSFFREGDRFFLQVINQDKIEIFPSSENVFFMKEARGGSAEFAKD